MTISDKSPEINITLDEASHPSRNCVPMQVHQLHRHQLSSLLYLTIHLTIHLCGHIHNSSEFLMGISQ